MKQIKKDLLAVSKSIKQLTRKTEQMAKRLEKLEKAQAAKKKVAKKPRKVTEIDAVLARILRDKICSTDIILAHIIRNRDGIDMATLEKKTGLKNNTVMQIIQRLQTQGKIKSKRRKGLRGEAYKIGGHRSLYFEA